MKKMTLVGSIVCMYCFVCLVGISTAIANNNPVARAITTTAPQGGWKTIPFDLGKYKLATDADNDPLVIYSANAGSHGTINIAPDGQSMTYTNLTGLTNEVKVVTYVVSDGNGGFGTNTVSVTLTTPLGANLVSIDGNVLTYAGIIGATYALENSPTPVPFVPTTVATEVAGANGMIVFTLASPSGYYRTRYVSGP